MAMPVSKTHGAVIVTRVSTGEQDRHGTSPETQLGTCRAKAAHLGIPIIAEHYDGGVSGAFLASRAGMQAAIADIREGRADTMICPTISRYSRDRAHQEAIKKAVHQAGGRLVFCDMEYTDTAAGNLQFNIAGDFAVYERELFRERSLLGKRNRAENGIQPARSLAPYGYHIPTKADVMHGLHPLEQLGRYVVVEEHAAIVRRLFECYAGGTHSMHRICQELNAEGVPTAKGAEAWRPASIKAILANPVHKGEPAYGKVKHRKTEERLEETNPLTGRPYRCPISRQAADSGEIVTLSAPAIVSTELWDEAQRRSAHNKAHKGGQPSRVQMLSGFAKCPSCGGGMRYEVERQGDRRYRYYICHRHIECRRAGLPTTCEQTSFNVDEAEGAVLTSLVEALDRPEWVLAQLTAHTPAILSREAIRREIGDLDRALSETGPAGGCGGASTDTRDHGRSLPGRLHRGSCRYRGPPQRHGHSAWAAPPAGGQPPEWGGAAQPGEGLAPGCGRRKAGAHLPATRGVL